MEFLHPAMWDDHDIGFVRWLHPAMWHAALESWQWIHQVAAPCDVTRGCGMTCHWIRPNARNIGILHLVSISTHHRSCDMSFCTSLRNFIQIGPTSAKKMTSCRFSRWRISAILDCRDPIMGSLKSPCTTFYRSLIATIALNCLVFEKIAFFAFWRQTDKLTDGQTDGQLRCTKPPSLSRAAA